jgi:hypothetical protein
MGHDQMVLGVDGDLHIVAVLAETWSYRRCWLSEPL